MNDAKKNKRHKLVEEIKLILTKWNPLGDRKDQIKDLNDYETEANDILFHIETGFIFSKNRKSETRIRRIVKDILNEAFYLSLTDEECEKYSTKIMKLVQQSSA